MERRTVLICKAGLHLSFRISKQIRPRASYRQTIQIGGGRERKEGTYQSTREENGGDRLVFSLTPCVSLFLMSTETMCHGVGVVGCGSLHHSLFLRPDVRLLVFSFGRLLFHVLWTTQTNSVHAVWT